MGAPKFHKIQFFLLLTSIMFITGKINAQSSKLIPPLPEAASFFKSTDIPVSLYSGLPNIEVPLYTVKTKELSIPIDLTYHARGILVAEVASRTGIGWALKYGGMISRQIRGRADDAPFGILNLNFYNAVFTDPNARSWLHSEILNDDIDQVPDQFYYDMNGESGKFTIDHNDKQIVLQKFDDIKIVPNLTTTEIVSWIVTDKLGNKYYYGRSKDGTRQANDYNYSSQNFFYGSRSGFKQLNNNTDRSINSWHLMEILTFLNEKIEFFYELEEGYQYRRSNDQFYTDPYLYGQVTSFPELRSFFSSDIAHQHQISEIRYPGGKLLFQNENSTRKDFTNTHALHKLVVKNSRDSIIKMLEFKYFYQRCTDDNNQLPYLKQIDTTANFRLFLSSIKEVSSSGDSLPAHRFEYNNVALPNRFSNSQDNWGFYNGKPNGSYLTFQNFGNNNNREVDTSLVGAGLLRKVTYPTGGSTTFSYEQNQVVPLPFINDLLYNRNNPTETSVVGDAFFKDSLYYGDGFYSKLITIGKNIVPYSSVNFSFVPPFTPFGCDPEIIHYQVYLESEDLQTNIYLYPPNTEISLNLQPGSYRLKVIPTETSDECNPYRSFIAGLHWSVIDNDPANLGNNVWYGAGKRIKKIESWIGDTRKTVKEYEYLKEDGTTSGKMIGLPNYYYIQKVYQLNGGIPFTDAYGSIPGSPLSQMQGNSLGYSRVTEYFGEKTENNGKTVSEFTTDADGGNYYQMPYHLPIDFEWLRGKLLTSKTYLQNGSSYSLQKTIENKYLYAGNPDVPAIFDQPFIHSDSVFTYKKNRSLFYLPLFTFTPCYECITSEPPHYKIYYQSAGTFDLSSSTETVYTYGQELVNKTQYGFDYLNHYMLTKAKTLTSKGDTVVTTSYYLPSLITKTAAEQKLITSNRIALPVKIETIIKNSFNQELSKTMKSTLNKDWGNNLVLPEYLKSSINNNTAENELIYNSYTVKGSPTEMTPKTGVKEVFIWGYNNKYPVAKISGSNFLTVNSLINQTMLDNADQYTDDQIRTELQKIRAGLLSTNAIVSTYTYKPLVGITSVTDQNNQILYYEYDSFNRLSLIRDKDNKIIKKVCYGYSGQVQNCGQ